MKFVITENQKLESFQKIIDIALSELRSICNDMDAESEEIISFEGCAQLERVN